MIMLIPEDAGSAKTVGLRALAAAGVIEEEPGTSCQPAALSRDEAEGTLPARQQA